MQDRTFDQSELKKRLIEYGASLVGYADLRSLAEDVPESLPYGVSIAVALDPEIVESIIDGPTAAYNDEYDRVNTLLNELTECAVDILRDAGYHAVSQASTVSGKIDGELKKTLETPLPHKTVATRAGLGWIGKSALLVTREFGSALRLASVLTDAPVDAAPPVDKSLCGACRACVDICPAGAPLGVNWNVSCRREEYYDVRACFAQTEKFMFERGLRAQICGMCIAACPWTNRYITRHILSSQEQ